MKRVFMVVIWIVVGLIVLAILAAVASRTIFAQKVAESFEVNSPTLSTKILIATQGSSFKEALVMSLIEQLRTQAVYINVVDVSALPTMKEDDWQAIVIVNTCEGGQMQTDVNAYLAQAKALQKVVLLTTSGSGTWQPTGLSIDSISSASRKQRIAPLVVEMVQRVQSILKSGAE